MAGYNLISKRRAMYIDAPNRPNKNNVNQKKTPWGFGRTVECQWRESTRDKPCFLILLFSEIFYICGDVMYLLGFNIYSII